MLMLISSLLAVVYVWKVVEAIYFGEPSEKVKAAKEAPLSMLVPTYVVIGATVVFGCWTKYSAEIAQLAAKALLNACERGDSMMTPEQPDPRFARVAAVGRRD